MPRVRFISFAVATLILSGSSATAPQDGPQYVDAGGHELRMVLMGRGKPAVILESGLGSGRGTWYRVLPDVARFTRVVAYDRAGIGDSDPGPKPRSAKQIADELHVALKNAGVPPPYVLVGHSGSAFTVRVFAGAYPKEIAGIVLVDPTQEGLTAWLKLHRPDLWQQLESEKAKADEGVRSELSAADLSEKQAQSAAALPDVPIILLTGMRTNDFRTPELLEFWLNLQKEWLKKVPQGKHVMAQNSGHFIQEQEPELVVDAIKEIVEATRVKTRPN